MSLICHLCPRECGVDRSVKKGYCGMGENPRLARAALHFWEEPCISGTQGSGTVFFSGCTLRCAYCQNYSISHQGEGKEISVSRLADIFRMLEDQGAHNINLVTATPFIPAVLSALEMYRPAIPIVWNSGGYEKEETIKRLEGAVDIYLPDFKHFSPRLAKLCAGAPDYFDHAAAAIAQMRRQTGPALYDEKGIMKKGTLIRHLILPGCTMDSCRVLRYIAENIPDTPVSLMRQYSPVPWCDIPGLDRKITDQEYDRVLACYQELGLFGYTQEKESATTAYTPAFDLTGV
ncbi:MAG: radical SAM protein [Clostridiales bacterium]|nr:radical SAM protein [Clostridiales bacterium]